MAGSLTVGHLTSYSAFFAAVEIGCTVGIVGYAWRWVEPVTRGNEAVATAAPVVGAAASSCVTSTATLSTTGPSVLPRSPNTGAVAHDRIGFLDVLSHAEGQHVRGKVLATIGGPEGPAGPSKEKP